jgi:4-hydroxy-tetrahydrodipicolinate synthase
MVKTAPIRGLWCASLTPLGADGSIDYARLVAHVHGLTAKGVDGIVLFGTTGEATSFSVTERIGGLDALLAADIPPNRVVAATGCAALADTLALTRHALQSGCPRCLALPPFFWKGLSDEAVFRYYAALIDTVADARLRLYLYHIPQLSGVPISPQAVALLVAAYPGIIAGVKDSSGDFGHTADLLECAPGLSILVGHEPHIPMSLRTGGAGTISGLANLLPLEVAALLKPEADPKGVMRILKFLDIVLRHPFVPAFNRHSAPPYPELAYTAT